MQNLKNKKFIYILLVILIVIVGGFFGYKKYFKKSVKLDNNASKAVDIESNQNQGDKNLKVPDLDRPINITANLPEDAKKIATDKIKKLTEELKANNDLFDNWLVLGIYRKNIGDLEGAREVWEYASAIRPQNSTSFNNLGDLYGYYLKDYKKAEENFNKAIENGPDMVYIYRNFYEFYRYVMKDNAKAKAILQKGIKANPDTSQDLQNLLKNF